MVTDTDTKNGGTNQLDSSAQSTRLVRIVKFSQLQLSETFAYLNQAVRMFNLKICQDNYNLYDA